MRLMTLPGNATLTLKHFPVPSWLALATNGEMHAVCVSPTPRLADPCVDTAQNPGGNAALGACLEEPGV